MANLSLIIVTRIMFLALAALAIKKKDEAGQSLATVAAAARIVGSHGRIRPTTIRKTMVNKPFRFSNLVETKW